jgi:putative FmdB family regulatory protein
VPTYQYACTECGHAFEQVQSFSDDALTECPECRGRLRKVFNAVGVVFKGSGFYRTDSRSGSTATETAAPKTETKTESTTGTRTESKPAPAAASTSSSSSSSSSSD